MKAISIWQPWASCIPKGIKHYETRSWCTKYRGELLICSAKKKSKNLASYHSAIRSRYAKDMPSFYDLPFGQVVAIATMTDCIIMDASFISQQSEEEIATGNWEVNQFAWKLENIRKPKGAIAVIGKQGLFDIDADLNNFEVGKSR